MSLAIGDYVYVHREGLYGRIKDIWEMEETFLGVYGRIENIGEETFYTVEFPWRFTENEVFEESELVKLENSYFPKGTIVTGLKGAKKYNFTTDKAIMEVMDNVNDGRMIVKILKHKDKPHLLYKEHWVDSMWFECIKFPSNFIR